MSLDKQAVIAVDHSDLQRLSIFAKNNLVICGSFHLYQVSRGLEGNFVAPPVLSQASDAFLLDSVLETINHVDSILAECGQSQMWREKCIAYLLPTLFKYFMRQLIEKELAVSGVPHWPSGSKTSSKLPFTCLPFLYKNNITQNKYHIDFRTPIVRGEKFYSGEDTTDLDVILVRNDSYGMGAFLRNLRSQYKSQGAYYIGLSLPAKAKLIHDLTRQKLARILDLDLAELVFAELKRIDAEFCMGFGAMSKFLSSSVRLPQHALFNHVADPIHSGFVTALAQAGVKTYMSSHGAMVVTGNPTQRKIKDILSKNIYNDHPEISVAIPRSIQQITSSRDSDEERTKRADYINYRNYKVKASRVGQKYFIGYAPNFLPWSDCYHGLTISCFETQVCLNALIHAVSNMVDISLGVRIKTTVKDKNSSSSEVTSRGVNPVDVIHSISNKNVINCSSDSYKEFLSRSDLVVTEGVSSVVFDALEQGIPVLLLNCAGNRSPMVAAKRVDELSEAQRAPVYWASVEDDLPRVIDSIKNKHVEPLSLEELSAYVWVRG